MPDKGKPQDTEPLLPIYHPIRPRVSVKSAICTTFLDVTILVLASIIVTMWVYPVLQNMSFVNNEPFVKVDSVIGHLTALQGIALKHGGSRSVATGHAESVKFVTGKLQKLNGTMKYWTQDVAIEIQVDASPPNVNLHVRDRDIHMVPRIDVTVVQGSGSANVSSAYLKFFDECEPSNIDGDWVAVIAYNWPSKCHPCERIIHAVDSGAKAIIMYTRPGNQQGYPHALPPSPAPGRCHKSETLTSMQKVGVISLSDTAAFNLLQAVLEDNTTIDISIDSEYKSIISQNIISETHKGDSNKIILFGSHLDSGSCRLT